MNYKQAGLACGQLPIKISVLSSGYPKGLS